jgi:hypothetical protein
MACCDEIGFRCTESQREMGVLIYLWQAGKDLVDPIVVEVFHVAVPVDLPLRRDRLDDF